MEANDSHPPCKQPPLTVNRMCLSVKVTKYENALAECFDGFVAIIVEVAIAYLALFLRSS